MKTSTTLSVLFLTTFACACSSAPSSEDGEWLGSSDGEGAVVETEQAATAAATSAYIYRTSMGSLDSAVCSGAKIGGSWSSSFQRCYTRHELRYTGQTSSDCYNAGGSYSSQTGRCWYKASAAPSGASTGSSVQKANQGTLDGTPACMMSSDSAVCTSLGGTWKGYNSSTKCYDCTYSSGALWYTNMNSNNYGICQSANVGGKLGGGYKCWMKSAKADYATLDVLESGNCSSIKGSWEQGANRCWHKHP